MKSLLAGAFAIAFAPILVKAVDLPAAVIGYHRCGLALLFFLPLTISWRIRQKNKEFVIPPAKFWLCLLFAGLFFAADLYVWHLSIHYIGAGLATLLANTSAIYLAVFGALFLHERPRLPFYACLILAFVGIYMLVGRPQYVHDKYWIGITFGLATGLFYCGFILCLRAGERLPNDLQPWERMGVISAVTAVALLVLAAREGNVEVATGTDLIWMLMLALVAQVLGWLLIAVGLQSVKVAAAGMGLLLQPVAALVLGALIYDETLHQVQFVGAVLTLVAIYLSHTTAKANSPS